MSGETDAFGVLLRTCRRAARLSQEELAERSGLSVRAIRDLERGRTRWPYPDSLHRLADALQLHQPARAEFVSAAGRRLARNGRDPVVRPDDGATHRIGTSGVVPRQLPGRLPIFVGRRGQLAALSEVLHQPGGTAIIAAISGTAGVGKTALAVHWAHQAAADFPDGQLFVNLRGFDPAGRPALPADVVRMFLDALGIPAQRVPTTVEAQLGMYRSLLVGKRMLVVLDNARDVAQVRPLLPGSPTCRVVVTSRSQLGGLAAIEAAHPLRLDVLIETEARQLLRCRLGAGRLASDQEAVARIITSCGHLPLALCVVAARAATEPHLPLAHIAADLTERPSLNAFTIEGDPAADIREVFAWSYRQLDADAARVFRMIGLHPGPDLEPHAIAALASSTVDQARQKLDMLARASLIQPAGPARYGVHDLLRGYAHELAIGRDSEHDRQGALTRLFDYYLYTAATAMDITYPAECHRRPRIPPAATPVPLFTSAEAALAWLTVERLNLVTVTGHTAEHGWAHHATRLSSILFRYLDNGGHAADANIVHSHARYAARRIGDRAAEADALIRLGLVDGNQGRYEQAAGQFEQALALHREVGDREGQARALNYLALVHLHQGRYQRATGHLQQALALFRIVGERTGAAYALSNLGVIGVRQGRYQHATEYQQQALAIFRDIGDRNGEVTVLKRLGLIDLRQARYQHATNNFQQALIHFREMGDRRGEANVLARLGLVDLRQARYEQATDNLEQALTQYREMNDQPGQADTLNGLGEALLATGSLTEARARHSAALTVATQAGEMQEQARAHDGLAGAYQASGDPRKARHHWQEALNLYTKLGAPEADQVRARLELCR